ncbi:MAG: helix-turn-helix transcriptional regulator [Lentisphaeria bacterium]|nr:helix-turn-helix transcriptional regulator [Lentisphaeria bacterium]
MGVDGRLQVLRNANCMQLELQHFARGTWPVKANRLASMGVNRFFIVLANPGGAVCRVADEKNSFVFTPGYTYFIPAQHKIYMHLDSGLEFISIHFTLELFEGIEIFSRIDRIFEFQDTRWRDMALKAFEAQNEIIAAAMLRGTVSEFSSCVAETFTPGEWAEITTPAVFQKELDYIHSRPPASVTVEELAELHGVSRETFSRNFSRTTGISPKKLLNAILFNRSCRLLLRNDISVRETAFELGFSNEYYFSRFFRKHAGIAPGEYRRRFSLK